MNRVTFSPRRPYTKRRQRSQHLELELLEARNLLSFTNVLVNNPADDTVPRQDTQSETAIVLGANSNVIVGYNDSGAFSLPNNPTAIGYSVSTNAGGSFTDQGQLPSSGPYWAGEDPVLARSNKTGTVFFSTLTIDVGLPSLASEQISVFRSTNNGTTFNTPVNAAPGFVDGVDRGDKDWMAVDNYPGPGYGNVYVSWTDFITDQSGAIVGNKGIFFTRSTDDGQTWGPSGGVLIKGPKGNQAGVPVQGSFVTVGPDHAVYVFWWDDADGFTIRMRKSTDQGQTFGPEEIVAGLKTHAVNALFGLTYSTTNGSTFNANDFPQAAVNPVTGDVYVVYNDQPNGSTDKADIFFTMSTDGGNSWSKSIRVNDDNTTTDQWQPALAVTPDGNHVGIFWYDRRNDPTNNSLIDRYGVIGTISGHSVSFAPNLRVTDVSFLPAFGQEQGDPAVPPTYMSDYDMATADNNYFYTTWGDNRLSDAFFANQPDVRFAKIPVTEEDAAAATTAQTAATQPLAPNMSSDLALIVLGATSRPSISATAGVPAPPPPLPTLGAADTVMLPAATLAQSASGLLNARDIVFAAAAPTSDGPAPWDALALEVN